MKWVGVAYWYTLVYCRSVGLLGNIPRLASVDFIGKKNQVILECPIDITINKGEIASFTQTY